MFGFSLEIDLEGDNLFVCCITRFLVMYEHTRICFASRRLVLSCFTWGLDIVDLLSLIVRRLVFLDACIDPILV